MNYLFRQNKRILQDLEAFMKPAGDRLRSQARFDMFNDLSKDPDEEHAWSLDQSDCIDYQQKHGSLTIEDTSQSMQTTLVMFEAHNDSQRNRTKRDCH